MIAFDKGRVYSGSSRDYALLRWLIIQIILYRLGKKLYLAIPKQNRKGQVLFINTNNYLFIWAITLANIKTASLYPENKLILYIVANLYFT
jgi:hypothetical protein